MGLSIKKNTIRWFLCSPNFAVITNVVIKRFHCICFKYQGFDDSVQLFTNKLPILILYLHSVLQVNNMRNKYMYTIAITWRLYCKYTTAFVIIPNNIYPQNTQRCANTESTLIKRHYFEFGRLNADSTLYVR